MQNEKVKNILDQLLQAFESGDIPDAVAIASFPIPDIPSARWSCRNRTIAALTGSCDLRGYKQWLSVKRYVKSGSKAVYILSPCIFKKDSVQGGRRGVRLRMELIGFLMMMKKGGGSCSLAGCSATG